MNSRPLRSLRAATWSLATAPNTTRLYIQSVYAAPNTRVVAAANASANWSSFVSYLDANSDTLKGFAWWGCGKPGWWDDVAASGGGHFSITPKGTTDTVNMNLIQGSFLP